jgi:hypothetical protein
MPSTSQAIAITTTDCETPSSTRPAAIVRFEADSTCRPPTRSICRPIRGPSIAEITSDAENAPKIQLDETPRSCAMGSASSAGR